MASESAQNPPSAQPVRGRGKLLLRVAQLGGFLLLVGLILFAGSGHLDWLNAWVMIGLYVLIIAVNAVIFLPRDTGLIEERSHMAANVKGWDKVLSNAVAVVGMLGTLLVAVLDKRFAWSPPFPAVIVILGAALYVGGHAFTSWAMFTNPFFSAYVRIQTERGHHVIDRGPYRLVRHPGYLGMTVSMLGSGLLLASLWAFVPFILGLGLLVTRAALEDRTLQAELPGYREYTQRVRYRLVPGIW